jgi:hypothetical protein
MIHLGFVSRVGPGTQPTIFSVTSIRKKDAYLATQMYKLSKPEYETLLNAEFAKFKAEYVEFNKCKVSTRQTVVKILSILYYALDKTGINKSVQLQMLESDIIPHIAQSDELFIPMIDRAIDLMNTKHTISALLFLTALMNSFAQLKKINISARIVEMYMAFRPDEDLSGLAAMFADH